MEIRNSRNVRPNLDIVIESAEPDHLADFWAASTSTSGAPVALPATPGVHGGVDVLLAAARARLDRVPPEALAAERERGALIVDIRPVEQRVRDGELPGAVVVERNALEWRLDPLSDHRIPDASSHDTRIVLVCNEGYGSSLAAATLHDIGLHRATDMIGGFQAWMALDLDRDRDH